MTERLNVSSGSPFEASIGFSRAVRVPGRVVVSGTAPIWPDGSCDPDPGAQARRCLEIIAVALSDAGARLDDVNLHRFLGLVAEFRDEAQLVIVSHQKRTMEAADCLYGVSMQPGGSSKVVSEKVAAS